ncbi:acyl-CoA N-acyltransferase [Chytriomyces sp. MP71]|nr:acyl-CoA N-acyltransferase [Chytriomyces sp. MP71]
MQVTISREVPPDAPAIEALVKDAFANMVKSSHTEHLVVNALREADALTISLVAKDSATAQILGYVAVSPVYIAQAAPMESNIADTFNTSQPDLKTFGLAPVAVKSTVRRQGIATRLIQEAMKLLMEMDDVLGCVVVGNPAFYGRFGFSHQPELVLDMPGIPQQYFMYNHIGGGNRPAAKGAVSYHSSFAVME